MRTIDYARSLYRYFNLEDPPIDLTKLFEPLNIAYFEDPSIIATGLLVRLPKKNIILINSSYPRTKQRFALAHEIGHIVLNHRRESFSCNSTKSAMERSADTFAAELLMPKITVTMLWERYKTNPEYRKELIASKLLVSKEAISIRILTLGLR